MPSLLGETQKLVFLFFTTRHKECDGLFVWGLFHDWLVYGSDYWRGHLPLEAVGAPPAIAYSLLASLLALPSLLFSCSLEPCLHFCFNCRLGERGARRGGWREGEKERDTERERDRERVCVGVYV